jgi:hypothetical protein
MFIVGDFYGVPECGKATSRNDTATSRGIESKKIRPLTTCDN